MSTARLTGVKVGDHRRTLTAASAPARVQRGRIAIPAVVRTDDARLWDFYRTLGVVHYGLQWKRDAALRAEFHPARLNPNGGEPVRLDPTNRVDAAVIDLFADLDGGRGRIADTVGDLIVHLDVAGVGYPVYQTRGEEDRLAVFGATEIQRAGNRVMLTDSSQWPIDDDDLVAVVWRPSPERRSLPDSPLRSVADECEQLIAMTLMVRAAAQSRVNAGILSVPSEMELPTPPGVGQQLESPLMSDMITALTAPIKDRGSAASVAPFVMFGPGDLTDKVRHITLGRPVTSEDLELIRDLKTGIATGLDLPNEVVTGLGDMNHWGAWLADATAYTQHLDPPLRLALEGLTRQVFQPLLVRRLDWTAEQASEFVLWRDIGALHTSPTRVADAVALFDRGIVSADTVRRVAGYDDTDRPTAAPDPVDAPAEPPRPAAGPPDLTGAAAPRVVEAVSLAEIDAGLLARLSALSLTAIRRALDRAGARIRNRARSHPELALTIDGVPNREVAARLGRSVVTERLAVAESEAVTEDDFDDFAALVLVLLDRAVSASAEEAARLGGVTTDRDRAAETAATDRATEMLVAAALAATVARLYRPDLAPDPSESGEVGEPGALDSAILVDAMTVAGGGAAGEEPRGIVWAVGVANGLRCSGWLRAGGLVATGWKWRYGDRAARSVNFLPHLALDGVSFTSWEDPALANFSGFPARSYFRPQDHRGCLCGYSQELTEIG